MNNYIKVAIHEPSGAVRSRVFPYMTGDDLSRCRAMIGARKAKLSFVEIGVPEERIRMSVYSEDPSVDYPIIGDFGRAKR